MFLLKIGFQGQVALVGVGANHINQPTTRAVVHPRPGSPFRS
jgi:hypothetical protein